MNRDITNTGAHYFARALKAHGITVVFGLCGDHLNALYRAVTLEGIEIVSTRSESGAVHMADAWARTTGEVGVAFVTGCPGHTNALTGMSVATNAASPVIVVSGLTPVDQRERGGSQVLQQENLARPVTKWALEVPSALHMTELVTKAFQIASSGTPGAVSLSVPTDLFEEVVRPGSDDPAGHLREVRHRKPAAVQATVPTAVLADINALLGQAQRPVMILGNGARQDSLRNEAGELVRALGVPTFTIDQARGLVADDGQMCFGYADPLFCRTFRETVAADLIILVGAAVDFHQCFGREQLMGHNARILQISEDAALINQCRQSDVAVMGPPLQVLRDIVTMWHGKPLTWQAWLERVRACYASDRASWNQQCLDVADGKTIHPLQVCASLERHRTPDTGIVIDAGDYVHWARAYFPACRQGRWMDAVLIGNLGGSIPLGIGSQMAHGHGQTWAFIGDGGFGFYSWDLEVAVERQLPLKIILGNDACWGVEKRLQSNAFGEHVGCDLREVRYDKFAELVGARGIYVDDPNRLDAAVDELMAIDGPALLNVRIRSRAGRPLADFRRY